jgi:hypothetical protein
MAFLDFIAEGEWNCFYRGASEWETIPSYPDVLYSSAQWYLKRSSNYAAAEVSILLKKLRRCSPLWRECLDRRPARRSELGGGMM